MSDLYGKRVAICGRLTSEKRKFVVARLEMMGGRHVEKVTARTDILVLPHAFQAQDKPKQLQEAEALCEQGSKLRIMDEGEFISMLGL